MKKILALIEPNLNEKGDYTLRRYDRDVGGYVFLAYLNYEQYKDILQNKKYEITVKEVQ